MSYWFQDFTIEERTNNEMNQKRKSVFKHIYERQYLTKLPKLSEVTKDDEGLVQRLDLLKSLPIHEGCVNTICWNETGEYMLSGSDDQHLVITNGYDYKVKANYHTSHRANIFSAKFLPCTNDTQIVSCAGDGVILHTDLNRPQETYDSQLLCHAGTTTYEVITIPNDPFSFLSCGEDGTVRWFDLRSKSSCYKSRCSEDIIVSCQRAVTALAISPTNSYQLAIGCADSMVRIYDRRKLSTQPGEHLLAQPFCTFVAPHFGTDRHYRITSLSYSNDGQDMLVSYSSDYLYLFHVKENITTELKKTRKKSSWDKVKAVAGKRERLSPPPVRRLRLRGDWSDTGPDARPERDTTSTVNLGQARPQLQATLMQRMTDVLSRMLNDPMTRAALSAGGEDSVEDENSQRVIEAREGEATAAAASPSNEMETDQSGENQSATETTTTNQETNQSTSETPTTPSSNRSNITSHLHNHLTALRNLREGFIEQHGAEPSVSFRYSQQSTSNSTISLRVGNEVNRSCENEGNASTTLSANTETQENGTNSKDSEQMHTSDVELDFDEEDEDDMLSGEDGNKLEEKIDVYEAEMKMKYTGHRNARTMIKEATFWGNDYVMSGSDCGHVFIWEKKHRKAEDVVARRSTRGKLPATASSFAASSHQRYRS
ncbi:unnamed protein product [Acanthoscelides obtectus]|uniref:Uncharacterized protein n=2 Tax=Acanthoscelides obtectus TaxID=200917 RepID=A0A9P0P0Q2_ACAOB|nr:unnamed protein product [Acanthoscelides obtectus]CAK1669873.1 DDB1- and CUL4-associated factor 6 [Acanthoscelides obtectus]